MLIDPDVGLNQHHLDVGAVHRPERLDGLHNGGVVNGTMSSYTPGTADINQYLRVSATYTDNVGGASATSEPVQVLPLPTVSLELLSSEIAESGTGNSTTVRARLSRISPRRRT